MTFEPIWISSIAHLDTFHRVYRETPWWMRAIGRFRVPTGVPCVKTIFGQKTPIIMWASGTLNLLSDSLVFQAKPWVMPLTYYENLCRDLQFTLATTQIITIETHVASSPLSRYFNMLFARVRTTKEFPLADFLMCIGGRGLAMAKIRRQNEELFKQLSKTFPSAVKSR